jgi:hypothetical protein
LINPASASRRGPRCKPSLTAGWSARRRRWKGTNPLRRVLFTTILQKIFQKDLTFAAYNSILVLTTVENDKEG